MGGSFRTTRWSMVAAAASGGESEDSRRAMSELCEAYWLPIYAFARSKGDDSETALDLTQGFFAALLEKNYVDAADAERGRFRTFLIAAFKNYCAKERDRERATKRGGGTSPVPIEMDSGESRISGELRSSSAAGPEHLYERRWALALLEQVMKRLEESYAEKGRKKLFDAIAPSLEDPTERGDYAAIAVRLGMNSSAVKVAVHRLRGRYREMLRREVADTLKVEADAEEVRDEIRHLMRALST